MTSLSQLTMLNRGKCQQTFREAKTSSSLAHNQYEPWNLAFCIEICVIEMIQHRSSVLKATDPYNAHKLERRTSNSELTTTVHLSSSFLYNGKMNKIIGITHVLTEPL